MLSVLLEVVPRPASSHSRFRAGGSHCTAFDGVSVRFVASETDNTCLERRTRCASIVFSFLYLHSQLGRTSFEWPAGEVSANRPSSWWKSLRFRRSVGLPAEFLALEQYSTVTRLGRFPHRLIRHFRRTARPIHRLRAHERRRATLGPQDSSGRHKQRPRKPKPYPARGDERPLTF